jgi:2-iminobutanoate/2-iminopropanoate deaminase
VTARTTVSTTDAPTPTGPFNQAVVAGGLVFTAGQAGRDRNTQQMGDLADQTAWALRNLDAVLRAAGSCLSAAVKLTLFVRDDQEASNVNEPYRAAFAGELPARSLVYVSRLKGPEMLVEIEAVALVE